jgi:ABC-type microcin C transport system duplicated ATPase subunit YejF
VSQQGLAPAGVPLLQVKDLRVGFAGERGLQPVVHGVDFAVEAGQCLALVGESGSGKSVSTLALLGLLPRATTRITGGHAWYVDRSGRRQDLLTLPPAALRALRGRELAAVFQDPMTALNPVLRVGAQIEEALRLNTGLSGAAAAERALQWLERVEIARPRERLRAYPHELSGGMRQRVMIAMALCCEPRLLVADEPTTALDVVVQAQVLALMQRLVRETGAALIFITHDLGVVAQMADTVCVMRQGCIVERGAAAALLSAPDHPYTRRLLAAVPDLDQPAAAAASPAAPHQEVARLDGVSVRYGRPRWWRRDALPPAVAEAALVLHRGETLGLVGESGSGKSTLGRALLRLVPLQAGRVVVLGDDLGSLDATALKRRRRDMQLIFQDPYSSLDPRWRIGDSLAEPLRLHEPAMSRAQRAQRVQDWLQRVRLPSDAAERYPHEFSGGQRQRIVIARALMLHPQVVVADEAVSSLDVSLQAEVLELLGTLKSQLGLSLLFITHNLGVVRHFCDRVVVMQHGRIVESGDCEATFSTPSHPYTRELLAAVPRLRRHAPQRAEPPASPVDPLPFFS